MKSGLLYSCLICLTANPNNLKLSERSALRRILEGMDWLYKGAKPGDLLVFHYSGNLAVERGASGCSNLLQ